MGWKKRGALILTGIMLLGACLPVSAEEVTPAGYHVYDVQEDEAEDTWYGIARGSYLQAGSSKVSRVNSTHVTCAGNTFAHKVCDRVYVRIYLDKSDTAASGTWENLNYWTGISYGDSTASVSSGSYKVPTKKYYRVQGAHSATKDNYTESTYTCTDALYVK